MMRIMRNMSATARWMRMIIAIFFREIIKAVRTIGTGTSIR
jgi:hypothetical protein